MKIIKKYRVPIESLHLWPRNPRTTKPSDIERLKHQFERLGQFRNLLVVKNSTAPQDAREADIPPDALVVIGGNSRLKAARELGLKTLEVTLLEVRSLAEMIEISLADNDHAATYDEKLLPELLYNFQSQIPLEDYKANIQETPTIATILDQFQAPEYNEDAVPKRQETETDIEVGDLFQIGEHRLLCGDATDPAHLEAALNGQKADMVFTDPPYNVNYKGKRFDRILGDDQSEDEFIDFSLRFMKAMADALKPGGVFYICSGYSSYPPFLYAIKKTDLVFSCPIVWVKNYLTQGWQNYRSQHEMMLKGKTRRRQKKAEPIIYGWRDGRHYFRDTRDQADVWQARRRASTTMLHPTQKPIALIQRALLNSSKQGNLILDQFAGSGSTLIAAEKLGRKAALLELDPTWCDTIIKRAASYSNLNPADIKATKTNILKKITGTKQ